MQTIFLPMLWACIAGLTFCSSVSAQDAFSSTGEVHYGHYRRSAPETLDERSGVLTVSGTASVDDISPDRVNLQVLIKGSGRAINEAELELASIERKLRDISKNLSGALVVTEDENCVVSYDESGKNFSHLSLYKAFQLNLSAEKVKTAISDLLPLSGLRVIHVAFILGPDKESLCRNKARTEATAKAREKAVKFAASRHLNLGTQMDVVDQPYPALHGATAGISSQYSWNSPVIEIGPLTASQPVSIVTTVTARYNTNKAEAN